MITSLSSHAYVYKSKQNSCYLMQKHISVKRQVDRLT